MDGDTIIRLTPQGKAWMSFAHNYPMPGYLAPGPMYDEIRTAFLAGYEAAERASKRRDETPEWSQHGMSNHHPADLTDSRD